MAKKSAFPEEILKTYDELIASVEGVERKGATMPYTSFNGHMFSFLNPEVQLCLRLPQDVLDEFMRKFKTDLAVQHGTVLKEYVLIPDEVFKANSELKDYFALSLEYVKTLKPKTTNK
jgi:hypothetical protein